MFMSSGRPKDKKDKGPGLDATIKVQGLVGSQLWNQAWAKHGSLLQHEDSRKMGQSWDGSFHSFPSLYSREC